MKSNVLHVPSRLNQATHTQHTQDNCSSSSISSNFPRTIYFGSMHIPAGWSSVVSPPSVQFYFSKCYDTATDSCLFVCYFKMGQSICIRHHQFGCQWKPRACAPIVFWFKNRPSSPPNDSNINKSPRQQQQQQQQRRRKVAPPQGIVYSTSTDTIFDSK